MKKTVLITGASSGFGRETVKLFQQKGWNVIATMRSPEKEKELNLLPGVSVVRLDVTDEASIKEATAGAGPIDVLVNNAGYGTLGALEAAPDSVIRQQMEVNFFGVIAVTRAVLPGMRARRSGVIINVSSMGGRVVFPFSTLYHASKFAIEGLTESLQYELNPLGIRTKLIEPGGYRTDFASRSMALFGDGGIAEYTKGIGALKAMMDTEGVMSENIGEVAEAVYLAATDDTETLRYPVGAGAIALLDARTKMDDIAFKKMLAGQLGM